MKPVRLILMLLLTVLLTAGCTSRTGTQRVVSSFTFLDQYGSPYGFSQLQDTVWIADFVFTNCETVCPPMTSEMAFLQQKFKVQGLDVQFVSFTVDPEVDTPAKLRAYARNYTDDQTNWHFLTGYSSREITEFARENFQTIVQKPQTSEQVIHGTNFYLIAPGGRLVSEFNYVDEDYIQTLMETVKNYMD